MAALVSFKGTTLTVRVTHNVISELIRVTGSDYSGTMHLAGRDPFGFVRDVVFCSLRIYNPDVLGELTRWEVGDEVAELGDEKLAEIIKALFEDFITLSSKNKVASEKK